MKPHFIVLALIACGVGLSALAEWPTHSALSAHPSVPAAEVDLVALQQQANAALENLRRAPLSHQVPAGAAELHYSLLVPSK
jgi:hypothetical protein